MCLEESSSMKQNHHFNNSKQYGQELKQPGMNHLKPPPLIKESASQTPNFQAKLLQNQQSQQAQKIRTSLQQTKQISTPSLAPIQQKINKRKFTSETQSSIVQTQQSPFLIAKIGVQKYILQQNIVLTSVSRSLTDKAIKDPNGHFAQLHNLKNQQKDIYKYANCVCNKPQMFKLQYYGKNDQPFGRFIIDLAKSATKLCEHCNRLKNKHQYSYYHGHGRVNFKLDQQEYLRKLLQQSQFSVLVPNQRINLQTSTIDNQQLNNSLELNASTIATANRITLYRHNQFRNYHASHMGGNMFNSGNNNSNNKYHFGGGDNIQTNIAPQPIDQSYDPLNPETSIIRRSNANNNTQSNNNLLQQSFSVKNIGPIQFSPNSHFDLIEQNQIIAFSCCKICRRKVSPEERVNDGFFQFSFGRFLEQYFYNGNLAHRQSFSNLDNQIKNQLSSMKFDCNHRSHRDLVRVFRTSQSVIIVDFQEIDPYKFQISTIIKSTTVSNSQLKSMFNKFEKEFNDAGRSIQIHMEGIIAQIRAIQSKYGKLIITNYKQMLRVLEEKTIQVINKFSKQKSLIMQEVSQSILSPNFTNKKSWNHLLDSQCVRRKCAFIFIKFHYIAVAILQVKKKIQNQIDSIKAMPFISERKHQLQKKVLQSDSSPSITGASQQSRQSSVPKIMYHQNTAKSSRNTSPNYPPSQTLAASTITSPSFIKNQRNTTAGIKRNSISNDQHFNKSTLKSSNANDLSYINQSRGQSSTIIPNQDEPSILLTNKPVVIKPNQIINPKVQQLNKFKRGNILLPLGMNDIFIPVNSKDYSSIIAYTLHSKLYYQYLIRHNFLQVENHVKIPKHCNKIPTLASQNSMTNTNLTTANTLETESDTNSVKFTGNNNNKLKYRNYTHHHHHHRSQIKIPEKHNVFRREVGHQKIERQLLEYNRFIHFIFKIDTSKRSKIELTVKQNQNIISQDVKQSVDIIQEGGGGIQIPQNASTISQNTLHSCDDDLWNLLLFLKKMKEKIKEEINKNPIESQSPGAQKRNNINLQLQMSRVGLNSQNSTISDLNDSGTFLTAGGRLNNQGDNARLKTQISTNQVQNKSISSQLMLEQAIRTECTDQKLLIEIQVFYVKQFEALRKLACSSNSFDFIKSIHKALNFDADGGRSTAQFLKSYDKRYIFKMMKKSQFNMFLQMAPHYFPYMCKHYFHQLPSLICKIIGAYKIVKRNINGRGKIQKAYILVQQNLAYSFPMDGTFIYDLKGSQEHRFIKQFKNSHSHKSTTASKKRQKQTSQEDLTNIVQLIKKKPRKQSQNDAAHQDNQVKFSVKMSQTDLNQSSILQPKVGKVRHDTNFLQDRDGEPIPIHYCVWKNIDFSLHNDTLNLSNRNVVDYSLLMLINPSRRLIRFGIIDFIRIYTWDKKLESLGKLIIKSNLPTIVNPNKYKKRFIEMMKKSFIGIYGANREDK